MGEIDLKNMSFEDLQNLQQQATDELARKAASEIKDTLNLALKQINEVGPSTRKELKTTVRTIVVAVFGEGYTVSKNEPDTDWDGLRKHLVDLGATSKANARSRRGFGASVTIGKDWNSSKPDWLLDDGGKLVNKKYFVKQ